MKTDNEQTNTNQTGPKELNDLQKFMRSHTARFIIVGIISLILIIPLTEIGFLINERKMRQQKITNQLKIEWGDEVTYYGLVIKVPLITTVKSTETDKKVEETAPLAYFYPEQSSDNIQAIVLEKHRGIFKAPVFTATINGSATFNIEKMIAANPESNIDWSKARICLVTNKNARFQELSDITVNGRKMPVESNEVALDDFSISLVGTAPFPINPDGESDITVNERKMPVESSEVTPDDLSISLVGTAPFSINPDSNKLITASVNTKISGSQFIRYQPLSAKSKMNMTSNWNDPAFAGTSLPIGNSLKITHAGFKGSWNTLDITQPKGKIHGNGLNANSGKFSDIRFINMVDHYQLNERTVKYGLLVLVLTFAVFFLIQMVGKITIHPLHYFMIGLALLLFYSLLLSFSEQLGFIPAYLIASSAIILLISWYAKSILKSLKFALMSGLSLSLLYAFLLVIVNLEVYALIVGSIGLLFVLAAIMSVTRKLNFETA